MRWRGYLENTRPHRRLWVAVQHSLQEGSNGTGVGVQLSHMSSTTHERRHFSRQSLEVVKNKIEGKCTHVHVHA